MNITPQQAAAIRRLTRTANRRLERAAEKSKGQAKYLRSVVHKATGGAEKFSAATKGLSFEEAAKKLEILDRFLGRASSTRSGWEQTRLELVKRANEKLQQQGYDLSDDELAEIMIQTENAKGEEFYRAVNLVYAAKNSKKNWDPSIESIEKALQSKISDQKAYKRALKIMEAQRG